MFNLDKFISDSVTFRPVSMFAPDIEANKEKLTREIKGKKVLIVDDIYTTGATVFKMIEIIKEAKPKDIKVLVIAKTIDLVDREK